MYLTMGIQQANESLLFKFMPSMCREGSKVLCKKVYAILSLKILQRV